MLNSILGNLAPIAGSGLGSFAGNALGSMYGPVGAKIGGYIGGGLGGLGGNALGGYLKGSQNPEQVPQMNNSQSYYDQIQKAQSGLLNQLQQQPQFKPVDINPYLQGARQEFQQQIVPGIAERFSGANAQRSSAFGNALGAAGSGLAQKLAELQSGHARDQQSQMMQHRGQNLQQMGIMGNLMNQQIQLGQNQNQFNRQQNQSSWDPYIKAAGAIAPFAGAAASLYNNYANRGVENSRLQNQASQYAGNLGMQKGYDQVQHARELGAMESIAPAIGQLLGNLGGGAFDAFGNYVTQRAKSYFNPVAQN